MLSGEGNAGERWKTTIGLITKKQLYTCSTLFCTFLCRCFSWVQRYIRLPETYTFYGGNVVRFLVHFFFTAAHFHLALVAASISHFVTAVTKFSCCSSNKKSVSFFYLSFWISVALFLIELRWPAAYFLFFSMFLLLFIPNLWTWQLI